MCRQNAGVSINPIEITDPADPRLADYVGLSDPEIRRRSADNQFFISEGVEVVRRLVVSNMRLRSIVLLVDTKFVLVSSSAEVRPTMLPTTPAIKAIAIAIPKLTVLVFRFLTSCAVTTLYSEIHHGVTGPSGLFELPAMIKSYEREVPRRQLELVMSSISNLL